jgi:hypothetical protein
VQAEQTFPWSGMNHDRSTKPQPVRLAADRPTYLEVSIDPAAHGAGGLGPITRLVSLKTGSGQELEFELHAQVVQGP